MLVVGVVGSRDWPEPDEVRRYVARVVEKHGRVVIVSGGARGVDSAAEAEAHALGLDIISYRPYRYTNMAGKQEFSVETFTEGDEAQRIVVEKSRRISPPFFKSYGGAAHFRNGWIVDDSGVLVAFQWNGSTGTQGSIDLAHGTAKPCFVYETPASRAA